MTRSGANCQKWRKTLVMKRGAGAVMMIMIIVALLIDYGGGTAPTTTQHVTTIIKDDIASNSTIINRNNNTLIHPSITNHNYSDIGNNNNDIFDSTITVDNGQTVSPAVVNITDTTFTTSTNINIDNDITITTLSEEEELLSDIAGTSSTTRPYESDGSSLQAEVSTSEVPSTIITTETEPAEVFGSAIEDAERDPTYSVQEFSSNHSAIIVNNASSASSSYINVKEFISHVTSLNVSNSDTSVDSGGDDEVEDDLDRNVTVDILHNNNNNLINENDLIGNETPKCNENFNDTLINYSNGSLYADVDLTHRCENNSLINVQNKSGISKAGSEETSSENVGQTTSANQVQSSLNDSFEVASVNDSSDNEGLDVAVDNVNSEVYAETEELNVAESIGALVISEGEVFGIDDSVGNHVKNLSFFPGEENYVEIINAHHENLYEDLISYPGNYIDEINSSPDYFDNSTSLTSRAVLADIDLISPLKAIAKLTLRKCGCPAHYAIDVSLIRNDDITCFRVATSPIDVLVNPLTSEIISVTEAEFGRVEVQNLSCSKHKILFMSHNEHLLSLSGDIRHEVYDTLISPMNYCVENIQHPDGHKEWIAKACLDSPLVHKCCAGNEIIDYSSNKCVKRNASSGTYNEEETFSSLSQDLFTPLINDGIADPPIKAKVSYSQGLPNCTFGEERSSVRLGHYSFNYVTLNNYLHDVKLHVIHENYPVQFYVPNTKYCVDKSNDPPKNGTLGYRAAFCYEDPMAVHHRKCSRSKLCIRKCCPENQLIDMLTLSCQDPISEEYIYRPQFYRSEWLDDMLPIKHRITHSVVYGEPLCHPVSNTHDFYLLDDGFAFLPDDHLRIPAEFYCVDQRQGYAGQTDTILHYCDWSGQLYGSECWQSRLILYPPMIAVSCVFLLATILLYKIVPELRVNISGMSLVSHVCSLLVAFLCHLVIFMGELSTRSIVLCQIMAFTTQFSFLATFFWLNVMCFEMWYRIRFLPTRAASPSESRRKYKLYSLYGWGVPAFITAVTGIVQAAVPLDMTSNLTPNFGHPYCWFRDEAAMWLYFNGVVMLLSVSNIFFFLDLGQVSVQQCFGSRLVHVTSQQHMERIILCLKLFIVMGVTWVFEEISFQEGSCVAWTPMDMINILRGPLVFLSVVSTKSVFSKLKSKMGVWFPCLVDGVRGSRYAPEYGNAEQPPHSRARPKPNIMSLASIRRLSTRRRPSESGSRDSITSVKTQETSIDPKSESSVSLKASDPLAVPGRRDSASLVTGRQDSDGYANTANNSNGIGNRKRNSSLNNARNPSLKNKSVIDANNSSVTDMTGDRGMNDTSSFVVSKLRDASVTSGSKLSLIAAENHKCHFFVSESNASMNIEPSDSFIKLDYSVTKIPDSVTKLDESVTKIPDSVTKLDDSVTKLDNSVTKLDDFVTKLPDSVTNGHKPVLVDTKDTKCHFYVAESDSSLTRPTPIASITNSDRNDDCVDNIIDANTNKSNSSNDMDGSNTANTVSNTDAIIGDPVTVDRDDDDGAIVDGYIGVESRLESLNVIEDSFGEKSVDSSCDSDGTKDAITDTIGSSDV